MTTTPCAPNDIAAAVARGRAAAHYRPQPGLNAGRAAQEYAALAQDFRASAWEHLEQGDMDQASSKAWELVAETVKAISAHYGSIIYTYCAIIEVVAELAQLVGRAGDMETKRGSTPPLWRPAASRTTTMKPECRRTWSVPACGSARNFRSGFTSCSGPRAR